MTGDATFMENCGENSVPGQVGFTVQVLAQVGALHQSPVHSWIFFLESEWWLIVILAVVMIAITVVVVKHDEF